MRRTARALSVTVVAGVVVGGAAPVALAEPAAEVSPSSVHPGGSVTVSVSCDPTGGTAPAGIEATSQAFEEGTVQLQLVSGNDDDVSGPAYRGSESGYDDVSGPAYRGSARIASAQNFEGGPDAVGPDSAWTVDGTCPAAPGGQGKQWSATFTVTPGGGGEDECTEPHTPSCSAAPVPRGVRAGEGGAFTDSVPALVTGGLLIAGALGAAGYRVRRREPRAER